MGDLKRIAAVGAHGFNAVAVRSGDDGDQARADEMPESLVAEAAALPPTLVP